ncbi:MAG: membrane protein insertion efficiency factor YidD [Tissierellia bacterium]|nr:membrane protein insertion efficiency factor YidD [Tissierellia bacterium]
MTKLMLGIIWFYQKILSRYVFVTPRCRFSPTCSEYARLAYVKYGFLKGTYLSIRRILKCHPFHEGGYDPLP